ncbi:Trichothecene biosynthesis transcription regulator TRI6 [Frankliniella fusca]|uniref:Trichothecene biosynthesis transcription regulator TRI6 n=1 Tax=Frankliniella fusca TaxID=407009 RepID=A0AAE1GVB6_9NEOP|nr:Trichothecene biosynthesis transcription regulator TRI6 [Frankliniella fusca]
MLTSQQSHGGSSSPTFDNYFSEGGGLGPNLGSVSKRKVTARKEANLNVSVENVSVGEPVGDQNISDKTLLNLTANSMHIGENASLPHESKVLHVDLLNYSAHNVVLTTVSIKDPITTVNVSGLVNNSSVSQRKKGKPGVTYDEDDLSKDADGKIILPNESLIGSGPSFDYVVPIVIAMLAVPFVAVVGAFLYKKGRDFWDRRHYRRMDFLIDGMYND